MSDILEILEDAEIIQEALEQMGNCWNLNH
ncbi:hypothetical protein SAPIS_v1c06120 [Spiroplasma apis B31]|uniref:Uncharacterized protein n=1 Tax=Spiroplasma apis B31 TaxID=1276258 RepID=V5RIE3_SPIAP|nr:hypothetical protein SAPIS_v1c06120 [Spiroplasma apis B31]